MFLAAQSALFEGIVPMFETPICAEYRVVEIGDITRRKNVRLIGLQILINPDTVIDKNAAAIQEFYLRCNTDAYDCHIARHVPSALRCYAFNAVISIKPANGIIENDLHTAFSEIAKEEFR